jgi:2-iminobutanoate/2-iminopropanoate deaminase
MRDLMPRRITVGAGSRLGGAEQLFPDAVEWAGTLYLSGRADVDPATAEVRSRDFEGQARAVLVDAFGVLEAAGSDPSRVVRVECYLADASDFAAWNSIFADAFPPPRPVRTTLVADFAVPGLAIELQLTAAVGG